MSAVVVVSSGVASRGARVVVGAIDPATRVAGAAGDTGTGARGGTVVVGGAGSPHTSRADEYGGGAPVPHRQPSTSPSCTRVLEIPRLDRLNWPEPAGARK